MRVNEIVDGLVVISDKTVFLPEKILKENSKTIALTYPGDIIIAKGGNTLAKVGLVTDEYSVYATCRDVIILRTGEMTDLNKFYLWAYLHGSFGQKLMAAAFQSVTTRTAGFNTIDISKMSEASKAVMILLMLIGGSPGSTAGGMKTTTFTVLLLNAIATFRSQENAGAFGRRLEYHVIKNAATIAMLYFALFFGGGIAISVYEGLPLLDCLYEAASAVGTVGLTLGITPELHVFSQVVLIILMYLGRVGGLTLIYAVFSGRNKGNAKLPLEKITVG